LPSSVKDFHLTAIEKILVVRLSSIGDIILTTPLLRSLRTAYPEAHICFLIKKQFEELLMTSPYIDELITYDKKDGFPGFYKTMLHLREKRFDLYIDIHKNWRSYFLRWCIRAKKITTYSKQIMNRTLLIWFRINLYKQIKPVYQRYFEAVTDLGITYDGQGTEIYLPESANRKIQTLLSDAGFAFTHPLVVICPGAAHYNKRWKSEGFIETARYLIKEKSAFIVIHGGKDDYNLCKDIAMTIGKNAVNMAGLLSLSESAALLKLSSLVIANDTGMLHMAQSQKRSVVGIYGPTTSHLGYFPIEKDSMVVETNISCRPCTHNGLEKCPKKHFRCMLDITSEQVIGAALHYLN
jgi:lipopolysaccharide heptosyltransferase II